ncbi:CASC3/Barentsz eIF4AIII binding-domain-containing protein [Microdochium trichocladiopsis]|uniref:CASC3/Barentsz eIF4AIII binding-domain-containing protein n=1 Tax=Microdochium trichocladiopsis TaxID=1682393 RepID=A0A9P8Y2W2_9PEZI|nr:CASC3/Barentsz eIF4AIII binding-domain-containing protein [Microdochium trichocladiopsis]KAH7026197.1 CASC3/Barentsz eIF4AIII binding-domain-containing protein [Microdochium trichocladiopsis]
MAAPQRRKKLIGRRRRVEDEGDEDAGLDHLELDDDSLSEGSFGSDDIDAGDDSDTSNVDDGSTAEIHGDKAHGRKTHANGKKRSGQGKTARDQSKADQQHVVNGLDDSKHADQSQAPEGGTTEQTTNHANAPIVVSSSAAPGSRDQSVSRDRPRREHDEYRRKRDEDPAFVPNRGAFFMHDHRHAGPSANGFRPFGRGGRGRGRGGIGGPFAPMSQHIHHPADPIVSAPWAHDMHDIVVQPPSMRPPRHSLANDTPVHGDGFIPTCPTSSEPINRNMSHERLLGNVQIRVFFAPLKEPKVFQGIPVKQYTKLPDHRPPLRRDKPVRISLPDLPPRYVFPATDRSFIFIPRALRPNQQRLRGKPRSGLGSVGGYSRRTSIVGGSYYAGSAYSPSVGMSRRSSVVMDMGRAMIASPTGSAISRAPMAHDSARPVVRLPPPNRPDAPAVRPEDATTRPYPGAAPFGSVDPAQPRTHPLPQKPTFPDNRMVQLPMHQPRPQKHLSVADIEPPAQQHPPSQPYEQAFHQQVPVQVSNTLEHSRHASYPSQHSTGTPLSQIPERAIHAAPFHPTHFSQQNYYNPPYQMMQPQYGQYYPHGQYPGPGNASIPGVNYASAMPPSQPQVDGNPGQGGPNLVAQEVNGMVYYYDAAQIPPMPSYNPYPAPPPNYPVPGGHGMNGMVTPSPDAFYYPPSGTVYYS